LDPSQYSEIGVTFHSRLLNDDQNKGFLYYELTEPNHAIILDFLSSSTASGRPSFSRSDFIAIYARDKSDSKVTAIRFWGYGEGFVRCLKIIEEYGVETAEGELSMYRNDYDATRTKVFNDRMFSDRINP